MKIFHPEIPSTRENPIEVSDRAGRGVWAKKGWVGVELAEANPELDFSTPDSEVTEATE